MRLRRTTHPRFAHDALPLPLAAVEIELRDFQQVATGQLQSPARLRDVHRGIDPLHVRDAERAKELLARIVIRSHTGRFLKHFAYRENSSPAITEVAPIARRFHLLAHL